MFLFIHFLFGFFLQAIRREAKRRVRSQRHRGTAGDSAKTVNDDAKDDGIDEELEAEIAIVKAERLKVQVRESNYNCCYCVFKIFYIYKNKPLGGTCSKSCNNEISA